MRTWPVSINLSYPTPRAHRLERLRGVIPVLVVARRPDPQVVDRPDDLRLRFWGAIGAATDLPFAFQDVPTP